MEGNNDVVSTSSDNNSSNPCPICLAPIQKETYLDRCFHKFCFECILHWSKVVNSRHSQPPTSVRCPLCKAENISFIHGYDEYFFQRHYISKDIGNSPGAFFSRAHKYRLQCYYIKGGTLSGKFRVSQYWKSKKYLQQNRWLFNWLRRDIQALTQDEDVDVIAHHILGIIVSLRRNEKLVCRDLPQTKQEEFKVSVSEAARPFLTGRSDRFVEEVELFLASGLNIDAYDKVYIRHLGWNIPEIANDDEDDEEFEEHTPLVPYLNLFDEDDFY